MKNYTCILISLFFCCSCNQSVELVKHPAQKKAVKKPVQKNVVVHQDTSLCIAAVGDIMLGSSYPDKCTLPPDSARNSFKYALKDLREADLTFGNLEGVLIDSGAPARFKNKKIKPYFFRMPVSYAAVLKDAGFDVFSLANNHIGDFAESGRKSTAKTLDRTGIAYAGLENHPTAIVNIKGVKYGICAFAPNSHTISIHDFKNATAIIQDLKTKSNIVIVSFHGGGEGPKYERVPLKSEFFIGENRGDVRAFAHNAINAGADVIFGNGPHVSRAVEYYHKRLIAYSLGNFCTYKCVSVAGVCGLSPLLKVYLNKKGEFIKGNIVSLKQSHLMGLETDTLNKAAQRIKALTAADFPRQGLTISDDGSITVE